MVDAAVGRWFLSAEERGNPATGVDRRHGGGVAWSTGNLVAPIVHGATYFKTLHDELRSLVAGDRVFFTDWRGDADERLLPGGPTVGELLVDLSRTGVQVRALLWRSHSDSVSLSAQQNAKLGSQLNTVGAEVLLDQRVRRFGSHHQKLFVIQHHQHPERDVAFVGGIDLCHGRRDDAGHLGDEQQQPMGKQYGNRSGWHDATLELRGPVVGDLLETFVERWDDPTPLDRRTPYRMLIQKLEKMPHHPRPLPMRFADPPDAGVHAVQVLRTYTAKRPHYPFAPTGERSIALAYQKAFGLARSLIYVEDQYLWSESIVRGVADALAREPNLRFIAVVPRYPDADGPVSGPPNRIGQIRAMQVLNEVAPTRVGIFDLVNDRGTPIYVHAKVCIVDDVWMTCGSDNFNRRSWTNDSELTCAILDPTLDHREPWDPAGQGEGARAVPRNLRTQLWAEHLGRSPEDPALLDPAGALSLWTRTAQALDDWYAHAGKGDRPPGRVRAHHPDPVSPLNRIWATTMYRMLFDPDARPRRLRRTGKF